MLITRFIAWPLGLLAAQTSEKANNKVAYIQETS
jgi:hypothetical protein